MKFHVDQIKVQLTPREASILLALLNNMHEEDPPAEAALDTGIPVEEVCSTYGKFARNIQQILISS